MIENDIILNYLKDRDVKRVELLNHLNSIAPEYIHFSDREMRLVVQDLIFSGEKIGSSSSRGYFLINNDQDLADTLSQIRKQIRSLSDKAHQILANCGKPKSWRLVEEPEPELQFKD